MAKLWIVLVVALCVAESVRADNPWKDVDSEVGADLEDILAEIDQTLAAAGARGISFKQLKEAAKNILAKVQNAGNKLFTQMKTLGRKYPGYSLEALKYVHDSIVKQLDKSLEESKDAELTQLLLKVAKSITKTIHDELKKKVLEEPEEGKQLLWNLA